MLTRVALLAASLVASLVLAIGLAVIGIAPAAPASSTAAPVAATGAPPDPITQIDTVYVAPQATPPTVIVQQVVNAPGSGGEGNEAGGD